MLSEPDQTEFKLVQFAGIRARISVEVLDRTLGRVGFDALLTHDDSCLSLADPVGRAIIEVAGESLQVEACKAAPASVGSVVVTSAGNLPYRFLLRAITFDASSGRLPTERTVRSLARTALVRCETLGIRRLVVLASGESGAGLTPSRVAQLFGFALSEHLINPSLLEEVVLVLPDQRALEEFLPATLGDLDYTTRVFLREETAPDSEDRVLLNLDSINMEREHSPLGTLPTPDVRQAIPTKPRITLWVVLIVAVLAGSAVVLTQAILNSGRTSGSTLSGIAVLAFGLVVSAVFIWLVARRRSRDRFGRELATKGPALRVPAARGLPAEPLMPQKRMIETESLASSSSPALLVRESRFLTDEASRPLLCRRYVLLEEIGRGGMGIVHLSWDLLLRRVVAIKTIREDRELKSNPVDLLRREAVATMDLDHEGIVRLYHFDPGGESWGPFLVMEYVSWSTGERWIADSGSFGLPPLAVRDVGLQLCRTLAYAHDRGILHLDIKPSNVFVDPAGERTKLADFGLARALGKRGAQSLQIHATGTPAYIAPEQRTLGAKLSASTDVYLLSATLWDLATGAPPDEWQSRQPEMAQDRRALLDVLATALVADPNARPRTVDLFAERLRSAA